MLENKAALAWLAWSDQHREHLAHEGQARKIDEVTWLITCACGTSGAIFREGIEQWLARIKSAA